MDKERPAKGKGKMTCNNTLSLQGAGVQRDGAEKLDVETQVWEVHEALKAMIEEEERYGKRSDSGGLELVSLPDETNGAYVEAGRRYNSSTGEGVHQDDLPTCRERSTEDKVGNSEA